MAFSRFLEYFPSLKIKRKTAIVLCLHIKQWLGLPRKGSLPYIGWCMFKVCISWEHHFWKVKVLAEALLMIHVFWAVTIGVTWGGGGTNAPPVFFSPFFLNCKLMFLVPVVNFAPPPILLGKLRLRLWWYAIGHIVPDLWNEHSTIFRVKQSKKVSEDDGTSFFWNVSHCLPYDTVSNLTRLESSSLLFLNWQMTACWLYKCYIWV